MQHVMIDLETMDNTTTAAIIAIGAVFFNPTTGELGETFYCAVDLNSSIKQGLTVSAGTIQWWAQQSAEAKQVLNDKERSGLHTALTRLANFIIKNAEDQAIVWGNGADFDNAILAYAYKQCTWNIPWKFWNNRCYRTLKNLYPNIKLERSGTHHNALDDAISQAQHACAIFQHINKNTKAVQHK